MKSERVQWQKAEETRKDFNIVLIHQDKKFFISDLFTVIQDAISLILQDNVLLISNDFIEYTDHIGCAINLHSIMNSGLIPGGQILSKRQTVFFTSVDPMNKEQKDLEVINLDAPRLAWNKQKKWKNHQKTVYWVHMKLAQQKVLKFYQTRSIAIILYDTLPAYCIPKAIMMGTGEMMYEKVYASPRLPKNSFKDNWMKELGSEVAGGGADSQQTQPKTKNPIVRETCFVRAQSGSSVQEIDNVSYLAAKAPMKEQGDLFSSCVQVSVERLDEDKDADENVDADHVRTVIPVESEQIHRFVHTA